jgi:predicted metallo-beta-lactamase superfamily hydrolase
LTDPGEGKSILDTPVWITENSLNRNAIMKIEIIGAESLGVKGLCCLVKTSKRKILIDPGIALGYVRHKLLPHPVQIALNEKVQKRIIHAA